MASPTTDPFAKPAGEADTTIEWNAQQFQVQAAHLEDTMTKALAKVRADGSSATDLADYQSALSAYTLYRSAQTNTIKVLKDIAAGTISNFR